MVGAGKGGGCFRCGQWGHFGRECPYMQSLWWQPMGKGWYPSGKGMGPFDGKGKGKGGGKGKGKGEGKGKGMTPGFSPNQRPLTPPTKDGSGQR